MCFLNDSKEFQGIDSICIGKLSHVPSQPAVVLSPPAIRALRFDTWNLSGTQENVFGNTRAVIDSSQTPYQGILHSWNQSATESKGRTPCETVQGDLLRKVKHKIEAQFHCRVLQETINHEFLLSGRRTTELYG